MTNREHAGLTAALSMAAVLVGLVIGSSGTRPTITINPPANGNPAAANTLVVSGSAERTVTPDEATFTFGVTANAPTASEASRDGRSQAVAAVMAARAAGLAEAQLTSTGLFLDPRYGGECFPYPLGVPGNGGLKTNPVDLMPQPLLDHAVSGVPSGGSSVTPGLGSPDLTMASSVPNRPTPGSGGTAVSPFMRPCTMPPAPPVVVGYTYRQTFEVHTSDLPMIGKLIDLLVSAGVTDLSGLTFGRSDAAAIRSDLAAAAAVVARTQAITLAKASGATLGAVIGIRQGDSSSVVPYLAGKTADTSTIVAPGTLRLRADTTLTFALLP